MVKLRKQRKRKTYNHNVNRKRLRNKISALGKVTGCKEIKEAWDEKRSVKTNLKDMGLSFDPNETLGIPNNTLKASVASNEDNEWQEDMCTESTPTKTFVVKALEEDAKAPRVKLFRLPKSQVQRITYLIDKYGNDYKAMARDKKNYYQETWKQIRAKINRFKAIPEQYSKYLESKGSVMQLEDNCDSDFSECF